MVIAEVPLANRASNAPYAVHDGPLLLARPRVNQQRGPVGTETHGVIFQSLGTFPVRNGPLRVVLSNDADGVVVADAVQVRAAAAARPRILKFDQPGYTESPLWAA